MLTAELGNRAMLTGVADDQGVVEQAAALKLAYMEYADLDVQERLALLQGLLEQALDCEEVRDLITCKVEAMALPRQPKKLVSPSPQSISTSRGCMLSKALHSILLLQTWCTVQGCVP